MLKDNFTKVIISLKNIILVPDSERMQIYADTDPQHELLRSVNCWYNAPIWLLGADINAICQEAGMHAVRENRYIVLPKERAVSIQYLLPT